jgi:cytochrome c peroxidase
VARNLVIAAVLAAAIAVVAYGVFDSGAAAPTPLAGFSAPFVFGRFQVPSDNPLTEESVELGRRLFYDPRLSGDNTVSCSTCHQQHLAFTDGRPTGVGITGKPLTFNSMSLANLMWGPRRFFWNGRAASLEEQALVPIQHPDEMAQDLDELLDELGEDEIYRELFDGAYGEMSAATLGAALASFQRTLVSSNSRYDQFLSGEITLSDTEELGRKLFMAHPDVKASLRGANCIDCHSQFLTGGFRTGYDGFSNNGLDSQDDLPAGLQEVTGKPEHRGLFKVPTLRNIALTAPYMHDGRFRTLEEVLDHYDRGIKKSSTLSALIMEADNLQKNSQDRISLNLSEREKTAVIAFLHTLTDQGFVTDERFSNPLEGE